MGARRTPFSIFVEVNVYIHLGLLHYLFKLFLLTRGFKKGDLNSLLCDHLQAYDVF